MAIDWVSIGVQVGLNAAILAGFLVTFRVFAERWIKMAFVRWMKGLSEKATEEGGASSSGNSSPGGALKLGGFEITPELIQSISQIAQLAQQFGFLKGGQGGGGTTGGSGL